MFFGEEEFSQIQTSTSAISNSWSEYTTIYQFGSIAEHEIVINESQKHSAKCEYEMYSSRDGSMNGAFFQTRWKRYIQKIKFRRNQSKLESQSNLLENLPYVSFAVREIAFDHGSHVVDETFWLFWNDFEWRPWTKIFIREFNFAGWIFTNRWTPRKHRSREKEMKINDDRYFRRRSQRERPSNEFEKTFFQRFVSETAQNFKY